VIDRLNSKIALRSSRQRRKADHSQRTLRPDRLIIKVERALSVMYLPPFAAGELVATFRSIIALCRLIGFDI
jgi:hypothetical protein